MTEMFWVALGLYVAMVVVPAVAIVVRRFVGGRRLREHEAMMAELVASHPRQELDPDELEQLYHDVKRRMEQQGYRETHRGLFVHRAA